jgi:predicted nucleic acid-binding protein
MTIYDSIIAATCLIYDLPLWTYNKKDFKYIENLVLIDGSTHD